MEKRPYLVVEFQGRVLEAVVDRPEATENLAARARDLPPRGGPVQSSQRAPVSVLVEPGGNLAEPASHREPLDEAWPSRPARTQSRRNLVVEVGFFRFLFRLGAWLPDFDRMLPVGARRGRQLNINSIGHRLGRTASCMARLICSGGAILDGIDEPEVLVEVGMDVITELAVLNDASRQDPTSARSRVSPRPKAHCVPPCCRTQRALTWPWRARRDSVGGIALDVSDGVSGATSRQTACPGGLRDAREGRFHEGEWSRHSDLNRGPAVYETAALPLSYVGADQSLAAKNRAGSARVSGSALVDGSALPPALRCSPVAH